MQKGKIIFAGNSAAGKTSLLLRIENEEFDSDNHPTLTAAFMSKQINFKNTTIDLKFWDTAG